MFMTGQDGLCIGGLERFSRADWPGRLVATVFTQGCGWRCRFCHKPQLIPFRSGPPAETDWTWSSVLAWLRDQRGVLDGVVFSGGEPTLQPGLAAAMGQVRELGFRIGLHTGGPLPAVLAKLLPLVDWVGFDFKAPFGDYARMTGRFGGEAARASLRLLRTAGVESEVRSLWHPALLSEEDLGAMADALVDAGCPRWVLQSFRPEGCPDPGLRDQPVGAPPTERVARPGLEVCVR
jgi:pyruvate formate lyase activating enzyme